MKLVFKVHPAGVYLSLPSIRETWTRRKVGYYTGSGGEINDKNTFCMT